MIASDASPLICLAKAEKLYLLRELFGRVVIEEEVKQEAIERGKEKGDPDALVIENAVKEGWIEVKKIVLDTSVVVKWFSEEEDTDKALEKRFELCKIHR